MSEKSSGQIKQTAFYNHKILDSAIYDYTKTKGYFEVDYSRQKHFAIMMPPPNVTGVLHIGHALTFSLQDIIVRYKRMDGYATLYQPGLDHAGIATQNIVEKQLLTQNISKDSIGREKFLEKVWEWKEESGGKILTQMQRLGITPAWSRLRFTMDEGLQNAVKKAFITWYENGLITRDYHMINWCVKDGALSDIEVEYKANNGFLYHLKYPLIRNESENELEKDTFLIVATTRPETFFGDSAVMVNPHDERYRHLVGRKVLLPIVNRAIPIIADEVVDSEFGSGCVKVTPAHDVNDYEVSGRHGLERIVIFDEKGILNEKCGEFAGLDRLEARDSIVKKLEALGFIAKIESYENQVGTCYRCGNIIEPYISKQWFVKKEVATNAIKRVNDGEMQFIPVQWINNYNAWMRELRPWCISRQLWWGHRIPVFYCECSYEFASELETPICPKCGSSTLKQDKDVLDTWFSSALWAFSTLGWGNKLDSEDIESSKNTSLFNPQDLKLFYPNDLLITGFDILFFWVARMLLSAESLLKELPFKKIYLHALVRDEHGQKMSKSKGNVIDPLEIIDTYGADCVRFTLASLCAQGRDVRLSNKELELNKNFINKIFNAAQFLKLYADQVEEGRAFTELENYKSELGIYLDSRLSYTISALRKALDEYRFNEATYIISHFLWEEFCDWGIEFAKVQKDAIFELGSVFLQALKLLHPFMPFVSDYLYHDLCALELFSTPSIMVSVFPCAKARNEKLESEFELIKDCIVSIRRIRANLELGNKLIEKAYLMLPSNVELSSHLAFICKLARVQDIEFTSSKIKGVVSDVGEFVQSFIKLDNIDTGAIVARLNAQKIKCEKEITKLESMLKNKNFIKNAPKELIAQNTDALELAQKRLEKIIKELEGLANF